MLRCRLETLNDSIDSEHVDMIYAFHLVRWKGQGLFAVLSSHKHICELHSDAVLTSAQATGDKNERRRTQRADKAASVAALLQHAISDDRFAVAVQELETSFGAKFSDFITGPYACCCTATGGSRGPPPVECEIHCYA